MSIATNQTKLETLMSRINALPSAPSGTKSITANGTYDVTNYASASVNVPITAFNCYIAEMTLATHQSTNVTLLTMPDEVYAHIDDSNFNVSIICIDTSLLTSYDDYRISVSNNANQPLVSSSVQYGTGSRKVSASSVVNYAIYYPANATDNTTSLGGLGKVWHSGKTLYYKSGSYFMGAGTYRIVISW